MTQNTAAAEARRAYKRNWAKKNPDKVRAQQARYWEKKAAEQQAQREQEATANGQPGQA